MLTAIELGPKTLTAVVVKINGRGPEIIQSGTAELEAVEAESVRTALGKTGVTCARGVLVISRRHALLRELELPAGSPNELVAMVRFQVEREMPLPIDQVRYSYIETARAEGKVRVQVAAVPRDVLDPAVAALEAAGVKISGAYVSSFGLLSLYSKASPAALVEVARGEAEILVTAGGRMELSRTAPLDDGVRADQIAHEIRRTLQAYSTRGEGREISEILLAGEGSDALALAEAVGQALDRPVTPVGPGTLETASAAGVCASLLRNGALPDLLHPPAVVKRLTLTRAHRIAALSAAIMLALFIWSQLALSAKRNELDRKRQELQSLNPRTTALVRMQEQTQLANRWFRNRNGWIDLLTALRQHVNTNSLWILNASFEDPGVIRLQGKARDDSNVTDFVTALKKTGKFATISIDRINDSNKADYRKDFTVNAQLSGMDSRGRAPARPVR